MDWTICENSSVFCDFLSEFEVFFRPEATLGGVRGSSWHQTPILHDLGGQNGVAVGPSGAQGTPLSAFFSHWEVRIRVMSVQNWLDD